MVLAFHENIEASKGTKNMLKLAQKAGLPTFLNLTSGTMHEFREWYSSRQLRRDFQSFLEDPQSFENLQSLQGDDY